MFANVVLNIPDIRHQGFDYKIPDNLLPTVKIGCRVLVPLGRRIVQGYVIEINPTTNFKKIKNVSKNLDIVPLFNRELIELAKWMNIYYSTHLFFALQMLIPTAMKAKVEMFILVNSNIDINNLVESEKEIYYLIKKHQPVELHMLFKHFYNKKDLINNMLDTETLFIKSEYKSENKRKVINIVKLKLTKNKLLDESAALQKNAKKQKEVLEYFYANNLQEIELSTLLKDLSISSATVKALVGKNIFEIIKKEIDRDPFNNKHFNDKQVILSSQQEDVLNNIIESINNEGSKTLLLHGVTGSGKTEIYLNIIDNMLMDDKNSIVLVPEISLTTQMIERFKGRFGDKVAVLHSRLSQGEKLDEWIRIKRGDAKIVIGARSAVFAPFTNIGLIILDEEHETSYKQEEHPKYHTREIAKWRANYNNAIVLLGSATPSMESYYNALNHQYALLELPNRIKGSSLPNIEVVDMREELKKGNRLMFSESLQEKINECLSRKEQVIIFLNRRGYSTFVMCRSCGYVIKCPHCEISLTYHQNNNVLRCHYCGYAVNEPKICPECNSTHIRFFGTGTQKVEAELGRIFPSASVLRMDVDNTRKKGAHEGILTAFKNHEADILLGTQMIAKGLDFESVTLVGVIAADTTLSLPDFRAAERTFQLLTQVSGRAGRHHLSGNVVIQTYMPEHYSIQYAKNHDYKGFYLQELKHREMMGYPPFKKLILVNFSHGELNQVIKVSQFFFNELKKIVESDIEVLKPVISPISRIKDRNRFQCMIKYEDESEIISIINLAMVNALDKFKDRDLQISIDLDPYMLM